MNDQPEIHDVNPLAPVAENETETNCSEQKNELQMQCQLKYSFSGEGTSSGDASAELYTESLAVCPRLGKTLTFSLREINHFIIKDYQIDLQMMTGESLTLHHIGYNYENFARVLNQLTSEVLLNDLLFQETMKQPTYRAAFRHEQSGGGLIANGTCGIRLYETALVLMPEFARPLRFPYSDITGFQDADYTVTVDTDLGERIVLTKLGTQFTPLIRDLGNAMNELAQKTQTALHELWPEFDQSIIRRMASLMLEGKAASCGELMRISPAVWPKLEETINTSGVANEYAFLKNLSNPVRILIGIKRGLMGDLTGTYLWFLLPVYGSAPGEPGNAIAMEAVNLNADAADVGDDSNEKGKATYFFRIIDRPAYHQLNSSDQLKSDAEAQMCKISRCLQAVNFRREPIYLPDESLRTPRYFRYFYAMQSIPGLSELRKAFIGRVIHRNVPQWQKDVLDLLKFNTSTSDNTQRWSKINSD